MRAWSWVCGGRVALVLAMLAAGGPTAHAQDEATMTRGKYIFDAADCAGCHTDVKNRGKRLAGGRALATDFGTFFTPNITPDKEHGIGKWTLADFRRALREGIAPDGSYYYPVFPFPAFTGMTDEDIADLYAYLMAQPPEPTPDRPHQVKFPFNFRFLLIGWRTLFFDEGPLRPDPAKDAKWNRGRYLAEAVTHCGECHTPRNFLGALERDKALSGNPQGPDGQRVPNITPDPSSGIGKWSADDIATLLKSGQTPNFDFVGSGMAEVVKGTGMLSDADLAAIADYVKSVPPIHTEKPKRQGTPSG